MFVDVGLVQKLPTEEWVPQAEHIYTISVTATEAVLRKLSEQVAEWKKVFGETS